MWSLYSHVFLIVAPWLIRDGHLQPAGFQQRFEIFLGEVLGILIASVLHDFRFGARFCAKNKDTLIGGLIRGPHLGPVLRPDLLHRNRSQRDDRAEHIPFNKFRSSTGVELCVFLSIPHS